jgi:hypothetical protein
MSQLVVLCPKNRWLVSVHFLCRWHYRSSEEREMSEQSIEQLLVCACSRASTEGNIKVE